MIACYLERTSALPGETVCLHASGDEGLYDLEIARLGAARQIVLTIRNVRVAWSPTPERADSLGCGWPTTLEIAVGTDWVSGYYEVTLLAPTGETARHFRCVRAPPGRRRRMVLVLATNTLHAYNAWGGANAYCDVGALMSRRLRLPEAMAGAIGVLSTQRPVSPLLIGAPPDAPRLVNLRKRGFMERPWAGSDPEGARRLGLSPYDGSAGFLNKWEHVFVQWAETEGYGLDTLTDQDLDQDPEALGSYDVALLVGIANTGQDRRGTGSKPSSTGGDPWPSSPATPGSGRSGGRTPGAR